MEGKESRIQNVTHILGKRGLSLGGHYVIDDSIKGVVVSKDAWGTHDPRVAVMLEDGSCTPIHMGRQFDLDTIVPEMVKDVLLLDLNNYMAFELGVRYERLVGMQCDLASESKEHSEQSRLICEEIDRVAVLEAHYNHLCHP